MDSCHLPKETVKLVHELGIIGALGLFQKPGSGKTHMWFALVGKLIWILHQWGWYKWGITNVCALLWHCQNRLFESTEVMCFCQLFASLYAATEAVVCVNWLSHISQFSKLLRNIVHHLHYLLDNCINSAKLSFRELWMFFKKQQ